MKKLFHKETTIEQQFYRVLASSVCGILLCMSCLVGTTWAWFMASVENTENVIQLAKWELKTSVTDGSAAVTPVDGVYSLPEGTYTINMTFASDGAGDAFFAADTVYVVMQETKGIDTEKYSVKLTLPADYTITDYPVDGAGAELSFYFTRMDPGVTTLESVTFAALSGEEITALETTEAAVQTTAAATEATEESTQTTAATTEATEQSTEATEETIVETTAVTVAS